MPSPFTPASISQPSPIMIQGKEFPAPKFDPAKRSMQKEVNILEDTFKGKAPTTIGKKMDTGTKGVLTLDDLSKPDQKKVKGIEKAFEKFGVKYEGAAGSGHSFAPYAEGVPTSHLSFDKVPTVQEFKAKFDASLEAGKKSPPEVNIDNLGLQSIYEKLTGNKKLAEPATDQVDDVFDVVEAIYKERYGDSAFTLSNSKVLRDEASVMGMRLLRDKTKKVWRLVEKGKRKGLEFKNLDEVSQHMGLGKTADDYAAMVNDTYASIRAKESLEDFKVWAFPEGLQDVGIDDAWKAAMRLDKKMRAGKNVKIGDTYAITAQGVLDRTPAGKKLADIVIRVRDEFEGQATAHFLEFEKILKEAGDTSDEFMGQIRMALDGHKNKVTDPRALEAATKVRNILDDIYSKAKGARVPKLADKIKEYFPHHVLSQKELTSGFKREETLDAVVKEGLFPNRETATKALDGYLNRLKGNTSDYRFIDWLAQKVGSRPKALKIWNEEIAPKKLIVTGNLTHHRSKFNPWYDRNINTAIGHYIFESNRGISAARHLGGKKEVSQKLIRRIRLEGGNDNVANDLVERLTNTKEFPRLDKVRRGLMTGQAMTKLNPLTTMVNYSQALAVALETSPKNTIKTVGESGLHTLKRMFGMAKGPSANRDFAIRSGAIAQSALQDLMKMHGGATRVGDLYMRGIGFKTSEIHLRTLASSAGKKHAVDMAEVLFKGGNQGYARRQLLKLGVDPEKVIKQGYIDESQLLRAGKRVSDLTQFRGDYLDLPLGWLGPNARVVTQFKTFVYNQGRLINRAIIKEAKKGNMKPLLFFATAYPIVGAGYTKLIDGIILGKEDPETLPEWYGRGLASVGGIGLLSTAWESAKYGAGSLAKNVVGPTISDIAELGTWVTGNKSPEHIGKELAGRVPAIGRLLKSRINKKDNRTRGSRSRSR